jgi:hypothetical protein
MKAHKCTIEVITSETLASLRNSFAKISSNPLAFYAADAVWKLRSPGN